MWCEVSIVLELAVIQVCSHLHFVVKALQSLGIPTGLASNCDDRMSVFSHFPLDPLVLTFIVVSALQDLDVLPFLSPNIVLTSASLHVAKPAPPIL